MSSRSASLRLIGPLERALFLKSLTHLAELEPAKLAVFAEYALERSFHAGQVVSRAGRPMTGYHMLVEGKVRAVGGEYLDGVEIAERGSVGFLSLLAQRPDGVEITAIEDTVTLEFEQEMLLDLLEDDSDLVHAIIRNLARESLEHRRAIPNGTYLAPREGEELQTGGAFDLVHRIALLRAPGSQWAGVGLSGLIRIARSTPAVNLPAGTTLWKAGDRSEHALIIVSGTISCTTQWGSSRFRAGPGYPLGNLERFAGEPRWYTAVTETPVVALHGTTDALLDIFEDHFDLAIGLVRAMAERCIRLEEESAEIAAVAATEAAGSAA